MEKIKKIQNGRFQSDRGYIFSLYAHAAAFKRISDDKILILSKYSLPDSVFVVEWPAIVKWSDESEVSEEEVQVLMQIVLDINSIATGWSIDNVREPIPGR